MLTRPTRNIFFRFGTFFRLQNTLQPRDVIVQNVSKTQCELIKAPHHTPPPLTVMIRLRDSLQRDKMIYYDSWHSSIIFFYFSTSRRSESPNAHFVYSSGEQRKDFCGNYVTKLGIPGFHNRAERRSLVQSACTPRRHVIFIYVT